MWKKWLCIHVFFRIYDLDFTNTQQLSNKNLTETNYTCISRGLFKSLSPKMSNGDYNFTNVSKKNIFPQTSHHVPFPHLPVSTPYSSQPTASLLNVSVFQKRKRKPFPSPWEPADKARCTFITSWPVLELCAVGGRNLPQHEWITALRIRLTNRL